MTRANTSSGMASESLDRLSAVEIEQPSDIILRQIKALTDEGTLKPDDRLPSAFSIRQNHGRRAEPASAPALRND